MLHEVLLALSGHPSPLFGDGEAKSNGTKPSLAGDFPLLSPSERALLNNIGTLSAVHRKLRKLVDYISTHHQSIIARAVATSISQTHLRRFQQKIIDVEGKILSKDASIVGAYDIVPLASVVGAFDDWHRRMTWFWKIACYMQPVESPSSDPLLDGGCSGAVLINLLREEAQTGFPEIEEAAVELSKVAETAWLKQLASWLLYGTLPVRGGADFFIQSESSSDGGNVTFRKEKDRVPLFVTPATASSILFIGKSLHQVHQHKRDTKTSLASTSEDAALISAHLKHLSSLTLPILPAQLARAIIAIRRSLSQNVLQNLLPVELTFQLLSCLRQYFLLGRGEFAIALIDEADNRLQARWQSMGRLLQQDPVKALQGLSIKDAELQQALNQAWKVMNREDEELTDTTLDFAMKHISLSSPPATSTRPLSSDSVSAATPQIAAVAFNDLLFPRASCLTLNVESPLDLFITSREMETYSAISSYLLAIRRAQVKLSGLWRRTAARRDHSRPSSRKKTALRTTTDRRDRITKRTKETRKVWASCSAAMFLISETAAYLEGEIIKESCEHFEHWVKTSPPKPPHEDASAHVDSPHEVSPTQHDPETLAAGHRSFLAALSYALLLTDVHFTRELRSLLGNIDGLIAFFTRLLDVQQKLDAEYDADGEESSHTVDDERSTALELDRARKKVDSDLRSVVNRLRQLDHERIGSGRYLDVGNMGESGGFAPWKGGGVDRLLMKLEFGRMVEGCYDLA